MLDGSNDVDSRKNVPFGGLVDTATHLGVKSNKKNYFVGMNRHYQAKRTKYLNFHTVKTDCSQILHSDKRPLSALCWMVQICPKRSKMADGHRLEILCNRLTNFDEFGMVMPS